MPHESTPSDSFAGGPSPTDEEFFTAYYEHVAADDIHDHSVETLEFRAREHLRLAAVRPPRTFTVAVVNERTTAMLFVVADDMPHMVRSVTAELIREGMSIRLVVHPTFEVHRDPASHEIIELRHGPQRTRFNAGSAAALTEHDAPEPAAAMEGTAEIWIAVEISGLTDSSRAEDLVAGLQRVLTDVRTVAEDAREVHAQMVIAIASLDRLPSGYLPSSEQLRNFLLWLESGNFTLLGYCEHELKTAGGSDVFRLRAGTELGLLHAHTPSNDTDEPTFRTSEILTISTSDLRSTVERPSYLDEIRIKIFDDSGAVAGEQRFVGLFAPGAAAQSVGQIPMIREKVAAVRRRLGFIAESRRGTELLAVLESFPLDELFQVDVDDLTRLTTEILRLQERRQTRLFLRTDDYGRFASALIFLPRHRYSTAVRLRLAQELKDAFNAPTLEFDVWLSDSPMARVFFRILLPAGLGPGTIDPSVLERSLIIATRTWTEGLDEALRSHFPTAQAARLFSLWSAAFPASYRADVALEDAIEDIERFEMFNLDGTGGRPLDDPMLTLTTRPESARRLASGADLRIRLYLTSPQSLTQILPYLHNLGLEVQNQRPFDILRGTDRPLFLYDLGVRYPLGVDPVRTSSLLADAFGAAMRGDTESDRFDAMVLQENLEWQQVAILRAYAKYLQQLGTTNSYDFIADTFLNNARAARALLGLFQAKFRPGLGIAERLRDTAAARSEASEAIDAVTSLDSDRLLRTFLNLIEATTRTNFYRDRPYLSFKLQPSHLPGAPYPRPKFEIWVYSPRVEGVHLRFGPAARGGLRWSDRREDFRTEVLGLAKAQIIKNSVIVPTGAKGGFYPKRLPDPDAGRPAWLAEAIASYKDFLRGLLDVTDNLALPDVAGSSDDRGARGHEGRVVPPAQVVCHDDDDYYLVAAADKGTAAFSDIANEVASEYGFWLGDAFASGGSVGYDHKRMGITARGAWASAIQHFHDLGFDCRNEDFTVVGIGDMSGDVFGNGMLLSEHVQLVAAFDHRHIFLDPAPDGAASLEERRRLFKLPGSSWADYNPALISPGGGVHPRTAKSIPISPQAQLALGLPPSTTVMSPPELIRAALRAPVDLIYNGGIGTYIKSSSETNPEVGDKANDWIRINGNELRTRIIVEGGNLGVTQRGRVEAALNGVMLNTDATDNSAGVDCSDHEVNIKIFIDSMIATGRMAASERTDFLHSLSDDVARLVLKNNRDQNTLLVNDRQLVLNWSPGFERTMDWLEKAAGLDRALEALPTTDQLHERLQTGQGLTSPELSVLAAYAKIALAKELNDSDVTDDPWFNQVLRGYFPSRIVDRFGTELQSHPLRRQIISTVLANDIINQGGITFAFRAIEETAGSAAALARAFMVIREAFGLQRVAGRIAELPPAVPSDHGAELALYVRRILDRATRWYMSHDHRDQPVEKALSRIMPTMDLLGNRSLVYLRADDIDLAQDLQARWEAIGIPSDLARSGVGIAMSVHLLDISLIAEQIDEPLERIADLYSTVLERIGALKLFLRITDLPRGSRWDALARAALRADVYSVAADMAISVLRSTSSGELGRADSLERVLAWERGRQEQLARIKDMSAEVTGAGPVDLASISVLLRLLRTLVRT
ncbi:NAD-glutamate dehydrogenase [Arthrobacter sp. 18067]|uniref:NAD-glutamate dehydrogenase n=1 Tax=Arthrobacter sp. 18067 TaxID=2681413 RepID=UPI00135BCB07|nr:NAD-glutamate dehydrogenase [Arthrobacter sp. 18067]